MLLLSQSQYKGFTAVCNDDNNNNKNPLSQVWHSGP